MRYKKELSQRNRLPVRILMTLVLVATLAMGCLIAVLGLRLLEAFQHPERVTLQDVTLGINIFWVVTVVWIAMFVLLALGATYFKRKEM
jgi:heme/copper-type cytochrome/quinol oxidase subunit 2